MKKTRPKGDRCWSRPNAGPAATPNCLDTRRPLFIYPAWAGLSRLGARSDSQGVNHALVQNQPRLRRPVGYDLYQFAVLANQAQVEGHEAHAIDLIEAIYAVCDAAAA